MSVHMSVESKMTIESKKGITEGPNLATIFIFVKVAQSIDFLLFLLKIMTLVKIPSYRPAKSRIPLSRSVFHIPYIGMDIGIVGKLSIRPLVLI